MRQSAFGRQGWITAPFWRLENDRLIESVSRMPRLDTTISPSRASAARARLFGALPLLSTPDAPRKLSAGRELVAATAEPVIYNAQFSLTSCVPAASRSSSTSAGLKPNRRLVDFANAAESLPACQGLA